MKSLLRIDILIWDTYDSRHKIQGRDDIRNLERMYYHLFKNVFQCRWPLECTWQVFPDENSALNWNKLKEFLDIAGVNIQIGRTLFEDGIGFRITREFGIVSIREATSINEPLCQVADLFAGLGAYSYSAYHTYEAWLCNEFGQLRLQVDDCDQVSLSNESLSNRERERCLVIKHFDEKCKRYKLRVGLKSSRGFCTRDPRYPINFWFYIPQHSIDKAPIRA